MPNPPEVASGFVGQDGDAHRLSNCLGVLLEPLSPRCHPFGELQLHQGRIGRIVSSIGAKRRSQADFIHLQAGQTRLQDSGGLVTLGTVVVDVIHAIQDLLQALQLHELLRAEAPWVVAGAEAAEKPGCKGFHAANVPDSQDNEVDLEAASKDFAEILVERRKKLLNTHSLHVHLLVVHVTVDAADGALEDAHGSLVGDPYLKCHGAPGSRFVEVHVDPVLAEGHGSPRPDNVLYRLASKLATRPVHVDVQLATAT